MRSMADPHNHCWWNPCNCSLCDPKITPDQWTWATEKIMGNSCGAPSFWLLIRINNYRAWCKEERPLSKQLLRWLWRQCKWKWSDADDDDTEANHEEPLALGVLPENEPQMERLGGRYFEIVFHESGVITPSFVKKRFAKSVFVVVALWITKCHDMIQKLSPKKPL